MTAGEQAELNQLSRYIKDWREEDKTWKQDVSDRLKALEEDKIARDAIRADRQLNRSSNIWKLLAVTGFFSTTAAGISIAIARFLLHI